MKRSVSQQLDGVKVNQLPMTLNGQGRKIPQPPTVTDDERLAGRIVGRTLHHASKQQKDLQDALAHATTNKVSGYCAGEGLPKLFIALVVDKDFRLALMKALAEVPGDRVHLRSQIDIEEAS